MFFQQGMYKAYFIKVSTITRTALYANPLCLLGGSLVMKSIKTRSSRCFRISKSCNLL